MKTLLIPITSAWSVRNVVLSGILPILKSHASVVLAVPEQFPGFDAPEDVDVRTFSITENHDRSYLDLRERLGLAHAQRTNPRVANYNRLLGNHRKGFRDRLANNVKQFRARLEGIGPAYQRLVRLERERWNNGKDRGLADTLKAWGIDAAFFPVPHLPVEGVVARTAGILGLPTAAFVLSFDNLSTKGRHTVTFDRYLVWNPAMKAELRRAYSEVPEERVRVVGTPQFQFYFMESFGGTREALCKILRLDPHLPIVLFAAGADALTPHEVPVVRRLFLDLKTAFPGNTPQLVVRLHPIERNPARWEGLRNEFPSIRWSVPWKTPEENRQWGAPELQDIRLLCLLMRHSDVVLNSASTMTIDALVCDTPAVCLDYTLPPFQEFAPLLHNFYDFEHYRPITRSKAVRFAHSPEDVIRHVRDYLENPSLDAAARKDLVQFMVGPRPENAVNAMADELLQFLHGGRSGRAS